MKRKEQNCMNNKFSSDFLHDKNFCGRDQGDFFVLFYLRDYAFPDVYWGLKILLCGGKFWRKKIKFQFGFLWRENQLWISRILAIARNYSSLKSWTQFKNEPKNKKKIHYFIKFWFTPVFPEQNCLRIKIVLNWSPVLKFS